MSHLILTFAVFLATSSAFAKGFICSTKITDHNVHSLILTPSEDPDRWTFIFKVTTFGKVQETVLGEDLKCVFAKANGAVSWCVGPTDPVTGKNFFMESAKFTKLSVEPGRGTPTPEVTNREYYEFHLAVPQLSDEQVRRLTPFTRFPNGSFTVWSDTCKVTK